MLEVRRRHNLLQKACNAPQTFFPELGISSFLLGYCGRCSRVFKSIVAINPRLKETLILLGLPSKG